MKDTRDRVQEALDKLDKYTTLMSAEEIDDLLRPLNREETKKVVDRLLLSLADQ